MSVNQRLVLSVKQITRYIKLKLESEQTLQDVWVRGEISNFKHHSSGHMYFTLKDAESSLKCVIFATYAQKLGFRVRDGLAVLARGNISIYERDGQYQLYATSMQMDGIGGLYKAFEQLKQKLEQEGLFAQVHKKPIPRFPRAIGVITSPTGAAVRDMITTLQRRYPMVPILLCPVHVQGDLAVPSITRAIELMNMQSEIDVLLVGRGGGSLEELWAFNEEKVARSIFASRIPVISAVGHETDFTIVDFVSDLRAPTPTAAAELATPHYIELNQQILSITQRLHILMKQKIALNHSQLQPLIRSPYLVYPHKWILMQPIQRLDRSKEKLNQHMKQYTTNAGDRLKLLEKKLAQYHPHVNIISIKQKLQHVYHQLNRSMLHVLHLKTQSWLSSNRHLDALSPLKVMQRGYSLVYDESLQQVIQSVHQVNTGDTIWTHFVDGKLQSRVLAKEEHENGFEKK